MAHRNRFGHLDSSDTGSENEDTREEFGHMEGDVKITTEKARLEEILSRARQVAPHLSRSEMINIFKQYYENESIFMNELKIVTAKREDEELEDGWITAGKSVVVNPASNKGSQSYLKELEVKVRAEFKNYSFLEDKALMQRVHLRLNPPPVQKRPYVEKKQNNNTSLKRQAKKQKYMPKPETPTEEKVQVVSKEETKGEVEAKPKYVQKTAPSSAEVKAPAAEKPVEPTKNNVTQTKQVKQVEQPAEKVVQKPSEKPIEKPKRQKFVEKPVESVVETEKPKVVQTPAAAPTTVAPKEEPKPQPVSAKQETQPQLVAKEQPSTSSVVKNVITSHGEIPVTFTTSTKAIVPSEEVAANFKRECDENPYVLKYLKPATKMQKVEYVIENGKTTNIRVRVVADV